MENRKINISDIEYNIEDIYFRTVGGYNQRLFKNNNDECEQKVKFYLLERDNIFFWGKQRYNDNFKNGKYEHENGYKCKNIVVDNKDVIVSSVKYIDYDPIKNIIVQEYLAGYIKSTDVPKLLRVKIVAPIIEWLKLSNIKEYDLSENNIIVREENGKLNVKLIDFDVAPNKNIEWCINNINEILRV